MSDCFIKSHSTVRTTLQLMCNKTQLMETLQDIKLVTIKEQSEKKNKSDQAAINFKLNAIGDLVCKLSVLYLEQAYRVMYTMA